VTSRTRTERELQDKRGVGEKLASSPGEAKNAKIGRAKDVLPNVFLRGVVKQDRGGRDQAVKRKKRRGRELSAIKDWEQKRRAKGSKPAERSKQTTRTNNNVGGVNLMKNAETGLQKTLLNCIYRKERLLSPEALCRGPRRLGTKSRDHRRLCGSLGEDLETTEK